MVLKLAALEEHLDELFENDVNMYGTQAVATLPPPMPVFENDVNMYGTQAEYKCVTHRTRFENDVNMYGTQAL